MFPASLRGVPVERIDEQSEYWEPTWDSLDGFLDQESEEKALKEHYQILKNQGTYDRAIHKRAKLHQDNMSKHVKIREIFSDQTPHHPNQLVSKRHLPIEGFCQKELMYRIAVKISDLKVLNSKGILRMDAWDFLRWRIDIQINKKLTHVGESAKHFVRSAIMKLFDHQNGSPADPVMREAILLSAQYQNRLASFKTHGNEVPANTLATVVQQYIKNTNSGATGQDQYQRPVHETVARQPHHEPNAPRATVRARLEMGARQERRRLLKAQAGTYQGVNAFRAQRGYN